MMTRRHPLLSRLAAATLALVFTLQTSGPALATSKSWGAVKARYGSPGEELLVGPGTDLLRPFPIDITVEGALDVGTAQRALAAIGIERFSGADIGALATHAFPDWTFVVASFWDRVELYRYSVAHGIEKQVIVRPEGESGLLCADGRGGQVVRLPNDAAALSKLHVTACEVTIALGGLVQCALIGLAGPWFGVACGVKWAIIGILSDC